MIHLFTGEGRGKTTAAVGMCIRAKSRGLRVLFTCFMRGGTGGETDLLRDLSIRVRVFENMNTIIFSTDAASIRQGALAALAELKGEVESYDVIIADGLLNVLSQEHITHDEALEFLGALPDGLHIILTGANAPESIIEMADVVTEMSTLKDSARGGAPPLSGIDF